MTLIAAVPSVEPAPTLFASDDERWSAVTRRDPRADGLFYYSVRTTGVYCRPSCTARRALRENVGFHGSRHEAEQAGFRPCRRCWPNEPTLAERRAALVARACRRIEVAIEKDEAIPSLAAMAVAAGMSRFHFERVFKAASGLTPRAYATARRALRARAELRRSESVTEAIYGAGFNSNGRFYAAADGMLGMTPTRFRNGGAGAAIRFAVERCSLGAILVAATERGVCAILLGDDGSALATELREFFPRARLDAGNRTFARWVAGAIAGVETPARGLHLPLDVRGTLFQRRVWQALRTIPAGATASYAEIAARLGQPRAARAVARACATNPAAVAIPCHRVVRQDGGLGGYRWGVERKRALLALEARAVGERGVETGGEKR